jgi:hypothetical protein
MTAGLRAHAAMPWALFVVVPPMAATLWMICYARDEDIPDVEYDRARRLVTE